jgi:hypothetical protein
MQQVLIPARDGLLADQSGIVSDDIRVRINRSPVSLLFEFFGVVAVF